VSPQSGVQTTVADGLFCVIISRVNINISSPLFFCDILFAQYWADRMTKERTKKHTFLPGFQTKDFEQEDTKVSQQSCET